MALKTLREAETLLVRRFDRSLVERLLGEAFGLPFEPAFHLSLGRVTEAEALRNLSGLKAEVMKWREVLPQRPGWRVVIAEQRFRTVGLTVRLPRELTVGSTESLLKTLRPNGITTAVWHTALTRLRRFCETFALTSEESRKSAAAALRSLKLLFPSDTSDREFEAVLRTLSWLLKHPNAGLFPRALPVEGVDSKWLERRRAALARLRNTVTGENVSSADFLEHAGLLRLPQFVLVKNAAAWVGEGAAEKVVKLPVETLAKKAPESPVILIIENEQTALSLDFPDVPIFLALGYGVTLLAGLPWMKEKGILYFGDLDTHGLAILAECRRLFPQTESVLMDLPTFERWRDFAVTEPKGAALSPEHLTPEERALANVLSEGHLRLEQERIPLDTVRGALLAALAGSVGKKNDRLKRTLFPTSYERVGEKTLQVA